MSTITLPTVIVNDETWTLDVRLREARPNARPGASIPLDEGTLLTMLECSAQGIPVIEKDGQFMVQPLVTIEDFIAQPTPLFQSAIAWNGDTWTAILIPGGSQ